MQRMTWSRAAVLALTAALALTLASGALAASGKQALDMYEATVDAKTAAKLVGQGYDAAHEFEAGLRAACASTSS